MQNLANATFSQIKSVFLRFFMSSGCFYAEYSAQDVLWESGKGKVFTSNLKACISVVCNWCVCVKGLASEFHVTSERLLQT